MSEQEKSVEKVAVDAFETDLNKYEYITGSPTKTAVVNAVRASSRAVAAHVRAETIEQCAKLADAQALGAYHETIESVSPETRRHWEARESEARSLAWRLRGLIKKGI